MSAIVLLLQRRYRWLLYSSFYGKILVTCNVFPIFLCWEGESSKIKNKQTIRTTNSSYAICKIPTNAARDCPLFLIIQKFTEKRKNCAFGLSRSARFLLVLPWVSKCRSVWSNVYASKRHFSPIFLFIFRILIIPTESSRDILWETGWWKIPSEDVRRSFNVLYSSDGRANHALYRYLYHFRKALSKKSRVFPKNGKLKS